MTEHIITRKLFLPSGGLQVSQALPMGDANQLLVQVRVESGSAGTISSPPMALLQTSPDMENWTTHSFLQATLGYAPLSTTFETFGSSSQLAAPWIRVRYTGGSVAVVLSTIVRLFRS